MYTGTTLPITGLWGAGPTEVFAVGGTDSSKAQLGVVLRYDGGAGRRCTPRR